MCCFVVDEEDIAVDDEENDEEDEVGYPFHQGMPPGFPAGVGGLGGLPGLPGMIGLGGGGKEKLHLSTLELLICTRVTVLNINLLLR